jgi:hypothetical protein
MSGARLLAGLRRQLLEQARHPFPEAAPDLARYDRADVEAARLQWLNRVVQEHRAVVDYADLLSLLADVDAPFDALSGLERVIADEMRHIAYCRTVVSWLGGSDDFELDLTGFPRRPRPDGQWLEHAILRVTEELLIAEEASLPVQKAYVRACTEPSLRAVLQILLEDDGLHAAIGRAIVDLLIEVVPAGERDAVAGRARTHEEEVRRALLAIHRAAAQGGPGGALGGSVTPEAFDRAL